jgi:hypothetical protein
MAADHESALTRRPVVTVLDLLRRRIDHDDFDAVALTLDSVVVDLGYGDIRALPGSVRWVPKLRDEHKKVAVVSSSDRASTALELAGVDELIDVVVCGPHGSERMVELLEALDVEPARRHGGRRNRSRELAPHCRLSATDGWASDAVRSPARLRAERRRCADRRACSGRWVQDRWPRLGGLRRRAAATRRRTPRVAAPVPMSTQATEISIEGWRCRTS